MPTGVVQTGSFSDSLDVVTDAARIVREHEARMTKLVDTRTLKEGTGLDYREIDLAQLTAQNITESTVLDNPQDIVDTLFSVVPQVTGIHMLITDKAKRRVAKNVFAESGVLAGNAMKRKKDIDGLTILDGATTSLGGAGTTMQSGHISAAVSRIKGNTTEPDMTGEINSVLHGFQIKDLQDELNVGVGTYAIPEGLTEQIYRQGFSGSVSGSNVWDDGNISIDSLDDAKGGTFSRNSILLVQGHSPRAEHNRRGDYGGGADEMFMYDEYAYGERSSGNWLFEHYTDATVPTN